MKEKVTALFHWQQRNQNSDQLLVLCTLQHNDDSDIRTWGHEDMRTRRHEDMGT